LLYAIKRPFSYRVKKDLEQLGDPRLADLMVWERPGKQTFRFWQEGPGYDRNITQEDAFINALNYLHDNPVRRGLCASQEEWKWSSWHHYHRPGSADVDLPAIQNLPLL
jgi:putative transposase